MKVELPDKFSITHRCAASLHPYWLQKLTLYGLAMLIIGIPIQSFAQTVPAEEPVTGAEIPAEEPVTGAEIADQYFPEGPVPYISETLRFEEGPMVVLPPGQSEVIETFDVSALFYDNLEKFENETENPGFTDELPPQVEQGNNFAPNTAWSFEFRLAYPLTAGPEGGAESPVEVIIALFEGTTVETQEFMDEYNDLAEKDKVVPGLELSPSGQQYLMGVRRLPFEKDLDHPDAGAYDSEMAGAYDPGFEGGNIFRDLLIPGQLFRTYKVLLQWTVKSPPTNAVLLVRLRKKTTCMMHVSYKGDLTGSDSGDLAYYNNFLKPGSRFAAQEGVAIATGNAVDEGVLRVGDGSLLGGRHRFLMQPRLVRWSAARSTSGLGLPISHQIA